MTNGIRKRATRQLAAVYEALQGDHSHPSADDIYQRVRKKLPRISLGTVYRNLQRLVEEGKIRMFLLGERVARYDPMVAEHDHFICQQCGRVEDVLLERDRRVNLAPLIKDGFTVTAHSLAIHGLCQSCGRRQRRKPHSTDIHKKNTADMYGQELPTLRKEKQYGRWAVGQAAWEGGKGSMGRGEQNS